VDLPPPDTLTSVLFVTAAVLLVVVTAGVAFLSYAEFMDKKEEEDARTTLEREQRFGTPWQPGSSSSASSSMPAKQREVDPARMALKAKGFGSAAAAAKQQLNASAGGGKSDTPPSQ